MRIPGTERLSVILAEQSNSKTVDKLCPKQAEPKGMM